MQQEQKQEVDKPADIMPVPPSAVLKSKLERLNEAYRWVSPDIQDVTLDTLEEAAAIAKARLKKRFQLI